MSDFRCIPIATQAAATIRTQDTDPFGNTIRRMASDETGLPCRHCLDNARSGETVLLAAYDLPRPKGLYWTPSPIFVHQADCARYTKINDIPRIVRERQVSLRSYDANHQCLYDLGIVIDGREAEAPLRRALADTRTHFVNIHTAKPGCLLCTSTGCDERSATNADARRPACSFGLRWRAPYENRRDGGLGHACRVVPHGIPLCVPLGSC